MAQAGTAYVDIQGDFSSLQSQIAAQLAPVTSRFGKLGTAAAVGLGAIGAAAVGAGVALYNIGDQFDGAYDRIRVGTGATGKQLEGLKQDFKAVFTSVPGDAETVSTAITGLNQRLNLTGEPLQRMAANMVELSRITETDLKTNIETVTRVFGDFGIKAAEQPGHLDRLFRASQKTGVSVDKLASTMVQFGSPLRSLGFDFDEATAMVGKFEKEGVNTRLVMGSLRIALGRMADQGVTDAGKAFEMLTGQIKNAKNPTDATRKAIELFGARAGPDMARAIIEGRFEFDKLVNNIKNGKQTIAGSAKATRDFAESFDIFKKKMMVAVEPAATAFFNAVGNAMGWIADNSGIVIPVLGVLAGAIAAVTVGVIALNIALYANPFVLIAAAIGALIAGLVIAYAKVDWFRSAVDAVFSVMKSIAGFLIGVFSGVFRIVFTVLKTYFTVLFTFWKTLATAVFTVGKAIYNVLATVIVGAFNVVKTVVGAVIGFIVGYFKIWWAVVSTAVTIIVTLLRAVLTPVFEFIWSKISPVFQRLITGWKRIASVFISVGSTIVGGVKSAFNAVKGVITNIISFIGGIISKVASVASKFGKAIFNGIKSAVSGIAGVVSSVVNGAINVIKGAINTVISFINGLIRAYNKLPGKDINEVGALANGTKYWRGGLAMVGEQGPELVNLPRGSKVYTAAQTRQIAASGLPGGSAAPEVRVFIGDRELTDIVRVEMREKDRAARANYRTGVV